MTISARKARTGLNNRRIDTTTRKPGDKTDNDNSDDYDKNCAYAVADESSVMPAT